MALTKKPFHLITSNKTPTQAVIDLLSDKAILSKYPSLKVYLDQHKFKYNAADIRILQKQAEAQITDQVTYLAHLAYHAYTLSGDWGEAGEQQVKIAFCRNLLNVPPKQELDHTHAAQFMTKVSEEAARLQISALNLDSIKKMIKAFKFKIFGIEFWSFHTAEVTQALTFLGSHMVLQGKMENWDPGYIFAKATKTTKPGYTISHLNQELIRTPNRIMALAAIARARNIFIRTESFQTIFAQKWLHSFHYDATEKERVNTDIHWNIAEGIKQKVFSLYGVTQLVDLEKIETEFIGDMEETILFHELGHGIVKHNLLPFENLAIGEGTTLFGETIFSILLEFLADFAPERDTIHGAIPNMIAVAKTNKLRAEKLFYIYLSDVWFYNTEDTYMYPYSDMMALILLKYIQSDGHIDFSQMAADIAYPEKDAEVNSIYARLRTLYIADTNRLLALVRAAKFNILKDKDYDFKKVRALSIDQFKKHSKNLDTDAYDFLSPYWKNMLGYLKAFSKDFPKLEHFLAQQEKTVLKKVMILACGRKVAENYHFDHRKYIMDQMKHLGIIAHKP